MEKIFKKRKKKFNLKIKESNQETKKVEQVVENPILRSQSANLQLESNE